MGSPRTCGARQPTGAWAVARIDAAGISARTPHGAGATVQQPHRAVSLSRLHTTARRTPEIPGVRQRAGDRLSGLVFSGTPSGQPGSLHRLERRNAPTQSAFVGIQQPIPNAAVGARASLGVAHSRADGAPGIVRLAT